MEDDHFHPLEPTFVKNYLGYDKLDIEIYELAGFPIDLRAKIFDYHPRFKVLMSYLDIPHDDMLSYFNYVLKDNMPKGDNVGLKMGIALSVHSLEKEYCGIGNPNFDHCYLYDIDKSHLVRKSHSVRGVEILVEENIIEMLSLNSFLDGMKYVSFGFHTILTPKVSRVVIFQYFKDSDTDYILLLESKLGI